MTEWFARPVLHVSSVEASLRFYVDLLGFTVPWRVADEDGRANVAQVDRQGCALILAEHWPEKVGKGGQWGYRLLVVEDLDGTSFSSTIRTSRAWTPQGCVERNEGCVIRRTRPRLRHH